jgi:pimeloyl-ACP methyl ester carboxylesterase
MGFSPWRTLIFAVLVSTLASTARAQPCDIEIGGFSKTRPVPASGGDAVMVFSLYGADCSSYQPDTVGDATRVTTEPFGIIKPTYARTTGPVAINKTATQWSWTVNFDANETGAERWAYVNIAFRSRTTGHRTGGTWYPFRQPTSPICAQVSASPTAIGPEGGTVTAQISAPPGCVWKLASSVAWARVPVSATGTGNGSAVVEIRPNLRPTARSASLGVSGSAVTLVQSAGGVQLRDPNPSLVTASDRAVLPPAAILDQLPRRTGAVTDGLAQLLLTVSSRASLVFTIEGGPTALSGVLSPYAASLPDAQGHVTGIDIVPITASADARIVAVYTPPDSFEAPTEQRIVNVRVGDPVSGDEVIVPIELVRPPVVLIHGYNSSSDAWDTFEPAFVATGFGVVERVDYSTTSWKNFNPAPAVAEAVEKLHDGIGNATQRMSATYGYAAVRADVVAHSMGGLVTRAFVQLKNHRLAYRKPQNYHQGSIRRLVTLGTPHQGSRFGEILWREYNQPSHSLPRLMLQNAIFSMFGVSGGAVDALRATSQAFTTLSDWSPVLAHTVVGDATTQGPDVADNSSTLLHHVGINSIMWSLGCGSLGPLFDNKPHDIIVEASSQAGGLSGAHTTTLSGLWHVREPQSSRVVNRVAGLLTGPSSNFALQVGGGRPIFRTPVCTPTYSTVASLNVSVALGGNGSPSIASTTGSTTSENAVFTLRAAVEGGGFTPTAVKFVGPFGVVDARRIEAATYEATVDFGRWTGSAPVGVFGVDGTTLLIGAASIGVEPSGTPEAVRVLAAPLRLRQREPHQIELEGLFPAANNTREWRRLTGLHNVAYAIKTGSDLVHVNEDGALIPLGPGLASITATYRGISTTFQVQLEIPCAFIVSPRRTRFGATGGIGTVNVQTDPGCTWSVGVGNSAVQLLSAAQTRGPGLVGFRVAAASQTTTTVLTIADQAVEIINTGIPSVPGDFDGDGSVDLIWQHDDGKLAVWLMRGGNLLDGRPLGLGTLADTHWRIAASGDFDRDGNTDVLFQHANDGRMALWLMTGTVMLSGSVIGPGQLADKAWKIRASADMNGDGWLDIVWQHETTGHIAEWLMEGTQLRDGHLLTPSVVPDVSWLIVAAADMDQDGHTDLIWQHQGNGALAAWLMNGGSLLRGVALVPAQVSDTNWRIRGAGDFNLDGHADLVWQNEANGMLSVWLMKGLTLMDGLRLTPFIVPDTRWTIAGPR